MSADLVALTLMVFEIKLFIQTPFFETQVPALSLLVHSMCSVNNK